MSTEIDKLITKGQRTAMLRDLKAWVDQELGNICGEMAEGYARQWAKDNAKIIKDAVYERCESQLKRIIDKGMRVNVSFREYY